MDSLITTIIHFVFITNTVFIDWEDFEFFSVLKITKKSMYWIKIIVSFLNQITRNHVFITSNQ